MSVVAIRVISFVVVRPQREICWGALPKASRIKAKMLFDSAGRKFGDLIVYGYDLISGSIFGSIVSFILILSWLYSCYLTSFSFDFFKMKINGKKDQ